VALSAATLDQDQISARRCATDRARRRASFNLLARQRMVEIVLSRAHSRFSCPPTDRPLLGDAGHGFAPRRRARPAGANSLTCDLRVAPSSATAGRPDASRKRGQAPLRRAHQSNARRSAARISASTSRSHAAVHQPDPRALPYRCSIRLEKTRATSFCPRVPVEQRSISQRQTFGGHHQSNDDLASQSRR